MIADGIAGAHHHELRDNWRILLGCTLVAAVGTVGFQAYSAGAFVGSLTREGFTRVQLSIFAAMFSAAIAVMAPLAGAAMDRRGPLPIIAICVVGEALGFLLLSLVPVEPIFYASALVALAVLGIGTTPPGLARIVASHFRMRRGIALGIMICGPGITAVIAPPGIAWVIEHGSWRIGYAVIAAIVAGIGTIGCLIIYRSSPTSTAVGVAVKAEPGDWSALSTPTYWLLFVAFAGAGLFGGGYLFHLISILQERGFTLGEAAKVQSFIGVAVITGRLTSGLALDRFPGRWVGATIFTLSALGCLCLTTTNPYFLIPAALGIGLTIGAELDIMAYMLAGQFGLRSFSRLYGLAYAGLVVASGTSPLLISAIAHDGGYITALIISAAGMALSGALLLVHREARVDAVT